MANSSSTNNVCTISTIIDMIISSSSSWNLYWIYYKLNMSRVCMLLVTSVPLRSMLWTLCSVADVRFGVRLSAIAHVNKSFVWAHYHCQLTVSHRRTVQLLLELLFVKFGYFSVSCVAQADITYAIDSICTSWCVRCFMFEVIFYICT